MATIQYALVIAAPLARVYDAIAPHGGTSRRRETHLGLALEHNPGPEHGVVQLRVVDLIPQARIEWERISRHPASSPASVWTGTHFIFELTPSGEQTKVDFRQTGYDAGSRFFASNREAWKGVLENLKRVVESSS